MLWTRTDLNFSRMASAPSSSNASAWTFTTATGPGAPGAWCRSLISFYSTFENLFLDIAH